MTDDNFGYFVSEDEGSSEVPGGAVEVEDGSNSCENCGAKLVEYKHHLNRPLVKGLVALAQRGGGPLNIRELGLSRNVWDNFQKLRYFDLVQRVYENGNRRRGVWEVTDRGWKFLAGEITLASRVWTFRGERVRYEGREVFISDVHEGYQEIEVWIEESRPRSHSS